MVWVTSFVRTCSCSVDKLGVSSRTDQRSVFRLSVTLVSQHKPVPIALRPTDEYRLGDRVDRPMAFRNSIFEFSFGEPFLKRW